MIELSQMHKGMHRRRRFNDTISLSASVICVASSRAFDRIVKNARVSLSFPY